MFVIGGGNVVGRGALGRQAGGDVFRAVDFVLVALLEQLFLAAHRFADGLGPGLDRLLVRFLVLLAQSATRAKTHSAPAPAKFILAHMNQ
jgi:hypothetical protein